MTSRNIDIQLLEHVWRISGAAREHCDAILQDLVELSLPQFLALRVLSRAEDPLTPTELARELRCSKPNASQLITPLVQKECVVRERDRRDARVVSVTLTLRGMDDCIDGEEQLADDASRVFAPLDDDEKQPLLELLRKLTFPREEPRAR